jgi:hypothetical protein
MSPTPSPSNHRQTARPIGTARKTTAPTSRHAEVSSDSSGIQAVGSLPTLTPISPAQVETPSRNELPSSIELEVEDMYMEGRADRNPTLVNAAFRHIPSPSASTSQRDTLTPSVARDESVSMGDHRRKAPERPVAHRGHREYDGSIAWWIYAREKAMYESSTTDPLPRVPTKRKKGGKVQARRLVSAERVGLNFVLRDWFVARNRELSEI